MRVGALAITNVRSFRRRTTFDLREDLNICIGPNGGGKSNTLEILSIVINHILMTSYGLSTDDSGLKLSAGSGIELEKELERHIGEPPPSVIEIDLIPGKGDVTNCLQIASSLAAINPLLARYRAPEIEAGAFLLFKEGMGLRYRIENAQLAVPADGTSERSFLDYLRAFNALRLIAEQHPETGLNLSYPALLMNSRRQLGGNLYIEVQNTGINQHYQKLMQVSSSGSRRYSFSVTELALSYLGRIRRRAVREASRSQETFASLESQNKTLQLLTQQLARIGWSYELLSDDDLRYTLELKRDGADASLLRARPKTSVNRRSDMLFGGPWARTSSTYPTICGSASSRCCRLSGPSRVAVGLVCRTESRWQASSTGCARAASGRHSRSTSVPVQRATCG